jgi:hypothetical protein
MDGCVQCYPADIECEGSGCRDVKGYVDYNGREGMEGLFRGALLYLSRFL